VGGPAAGGGSVFHDSTTLIKLFPEPRPAERLLSGPPDARALVPPTMQVDSATARRWLRSSYWREVVADSLEIVWRNGLYGPVFRMLVRGDSLRGRVRFTTDIVGGEPPPQDAAAMQVSCPTSPG
jgi:hypothetical protein